MLNIILTILFINSLLNYIKGKNTFNTLNCGIWAYIGKDNRNFSSDKFNMLGIVNDPRGGDASGVLFDNQVIHKLYEYKILAKRNIFKNKPKHPVVIGHSRKSSSGGKLLQYTQPFVWGDGKEIQNGLVHNGTLYNDIHLSNKYKVPKVFKYDKLNFSPNDTQILGYTLMVNKDFSILSDYRGAAALIWEDRLKNLVYLFKGESKYYNTRVDEERPLFIYEKKGYIWVSSVEEGLHYIADEKREEPNIYSLESNTIVVIKNGNIIDRIKVERSNQFQTKDWGNNSWNNNYINRNRNHEYENFYEEDLYNHNHDLEYPTSSRSKKINEVNREFNREINLVSEHVSYLDIAANRYYYKSKLAEGLLLVDEEGNVIENSTSNINSPVDSKLFKRYFKDGVLITSKENYEKLLGLYEKVKTNKYIPESCTKNTELDIKLDKLLSQFSVYAVALRNSYLPTFYTYNKYDEKTELFTGTIHSIYTNTIYEVKNGFLEDISFGNGYNYKIPEELKESKYVFYDYENNEESNNAIDENDSDGTDREWENEFAKEQLTKKVEEIVKLLNSFEDDINAYEDTESSTSAQLLLESLREEILTSEFNS